MATIMSYSNSDGTRRCDARCHKATQPECECICGGRYHGCARDQRQGPDDIIDAELMLRGLDKNTLSPEGKACITREVLEMFKQYSIHDFNASGVQDVRHCMDELAKHREEKAVQRARRGKLSHLRGTEYMSPLFPNTNARE